MKEEKRKLTVMLPESDFAHLKVRAMLRKISVTELIIEMIQHYRRPTPPRVYREHADEINNLLETLLKPQLDKMNAAQKERKERIYERIEALSKEGFSHSKIAEILQEENVPTMSGRGKWYRQMVQKILKNGID